MDKKSFRPLIPLIAVALFVAVIIAFGSPYLWVPAEEDPRVFSLQVKLP